MMKKITPVYSKELCLKSLEYLEVNIKLKDTSKQIPMDKLFEVAIRKNKKRTFLFVSKILGKHLALDPKIPSLGGILLAYQFTNMDLEEPITLLCAEKMDEWAYYRLKEKKAKIDKKTLFIGFAETATGLGHSMFSACVGPISYIHTTREKIISEKPSFTFEEVHSHATGHQCFTKDPNYFKAFDEIVLVDDEITTGHTALHLIEALYEHSGNKHYHVVSLLDWRSSYEIEEARALEEKLGITISFVSLIQGQMEAHLLQAIPEERMQLPKLIEDEIAYCEDYQTVSIALDQLMQKTTKADDGVVRQLMYMKANGRFGLTAKDNRKYEGYIKVASDELKALRSYEKCLVIGTEEFIYIPCLLAEGMGEGVWYQSSTRSPIIPQQEEGYPIQTVLAYKRPEDTAVINYLYNIQGSRFDELFWIMERDVKEQFKAKMTQAFKACGIKKVTFVVCDKEMIER